MTWGACVEQIAFGDGEFSSEEEHRHGHAEQHAADTAVDEKKGVVGACAVEIAFLCTEFVADGLQNEADEDKHPQPVGTSEAG